MRQCRFVFVTRSVVRTCAVLGSAGLAAAPLPAQQSADSPAASPTLPLSYPRSVRFTTDEGTWLSLDVSPDGRTIVFDLAGDLYTLPITGGTATRITAGPGYDAQPRFSPDGRRILFQSDRTGAENLYTVRPDGQDLRALTTGDGQAYLSPTWTPDGQSVVVSSSAYPGGLYGLGLYRFPATGPDVPAAAGMGTKLPLSHGQYIGAAFGSDTHLVYYSTEHKDGRHGNQIEFVWKVQRYNITTKTQEDVALAVGGAFRPLLSPDGQWLVYASRHDTSTSLRLRNLATQQERWLLHGVERDAQEASYTRDLMPGAAFTPDSRALITTRQGKFLRVEVPSGKTTPIPFTATIDVVLGPRVHFEYPLNDSVLTVRGIRDPQLAPDNRRVVFTALDRLYVMDLPRGTPRRLTSVDVGEGPGEYHPVWSPDGRWIAYVTWDGRTGGVYRVRADGRGQPERLTREPGYYRRVAYTPTGRRLLVWRAAQPSWLGQASQTATALVWLPATGGATTVVLAGGGAHDVAAPYFVRGDSTRIYLGAESIRWDGTDRQRHLQGNVVLSPTGTRVFDALFGAELAIGTVPPLGGRPGGTSDHAAGGSSEGTPNSVATPDTAAAPAPAVPLAVRQLGGRGSMAEFPAWSADGTKLIWVEGRFLSIYDVARGDAAVGEPAVAEARAADSGRRASLAYQAERIEVRLTLPKDRPRGVVALRNARLLPMRGDAVLERGDLVVTNNRITAVGPAGTVRIPAGARVLDLAGTTILPGLVDIHAHPSPPDDIHPQPWPYAAALAYGVTTIRDPSPSVGPRTDVLTYAARVEAGTLLGPRIYHTGDAINGAPPDFQTLAGARTYLRRYAEIYQSETVKGYNIGERRRQQHFLIAARELGLTPTLEGGRDFKKNITQVIDGYSGHEHAYPLVPLYRDMVELIARSGITYTPTLLVTYGGPQSENYLYAKYQHMHDDPKLRRFVPHSYLDRRFLRREQWFADKQFVHEQVAAQAAKILRAGGRVGLGGHGQLPGLGEHWELWLLQSGGMRPIDALRSATLFGAEAIGHGKDLGSLEVGKLADLIVLDKNPLEDIRHSLAIRYVMKNGRLYDGNTLAEVWPRTTPAPQWSWLTGEREMSVHTAAEEALQ